MPLDSRSRRPFPQAEADPESRYPKAAPARVISIADYSLAAVANAARISLRAAGVALALEADGRIVCRARAGDAAPDLGTEVRRGEGITGECVAAGTVICCRDTERDPRVNAAACRQLGVRSLLVVPLVKAAERHGSETHTAQVVGIVEALFAAPDAFGYEAVETLQGVAKLIVAHVQGDVSAPPGGHEPGAARAAPPPVEELLPTLTRIQQRRPRATIAVLAAGLLLSAGAFLWSRHPAGSPPKPAVLPDHGDAWMRLRRAAEAGDPAAQYDLALGYKSGSGLPRDSAQAVNWLRQAAEHGNPEAQYDLAKALENGDGMPGDRAEAYTWYVVAGMAGRKDDDAIARLTPALSTKQRAQARFDIGEKLAAGQALPQDFVAAYTWFALSGSREAALSMKRVASQMTPRQRAEAQARAAQGRR